MDKLFKSLEFYSKEYDWEILKYGFEVLLFNAISIIVILLVASLSKQVSFGVFFMLSFAVLRITIGGYHCKTLWCCLLSMIVLFNIVLYLSQLPLYVYSLKVLSILLIVKLHKIECNFLRNIYLILYVILFRSVVFLPIFSGLLLGILLYKES